MSIGKNLGLTPQQQLIQYVKNPQLAAAAGVPAASALFELQQRVEKDRELQALKAREAMMHGPQSVADKTIAAATSAGIPSTLPPQTSMAPDQGVMQLAQNQNIPEESMTDAGVASLSTGDMYNEKNFAGGGIVAFDEGGDVKHYAYGKGVKTDPELYDPMYYKDAAAALVPTRQVPTADDYFMERSQAERALGIDPEYYKKRIADVESRNKEETDSAKRMANANILFAMADKLSSTPGNLLRGLSVAAPAGLKAGAEGLKELRDVNRLKQAAMDKLNDAKYAQDRGDVQAYMKHMEDYRTINANIEMKNAELETSVRVANVKKRADMAGKGAEIQSKIYDKFIKDFLATYPNGAQSTVFKSNPQFLQKEKNRILKNAQDYIIGGVTPAVPAATSLAGLHSSTNLNGPQNTTRPANIQSIMDQYED